ncbi:MAG: AAA family ATPase [Tannerella sp.]|jgi:hypothetical protein|nr:AAA family ATPase [Tannerella sp.]
MQNEITKLIGHRLNGEPYDPDKEKEKVLLIEKVNSYRLDLAKSNPDPAPMITLSGLPVCTRGNFSVVIGLPGSRKSFLCTGIAGNLLNENGYLGMEAPNGTGKILWIDTEQAAGHVARIGKRLHRIAGLPVEVNNDNIVILMLRELSPSERRKIAEFAIDYFKPDFIILDGLSDLITDPNNPDQSTEVISYLLNVTKKLDCHILTVIHANIGSDKARGHLGSEALRKCETAISITADGDNSLCKFAKTRDIRPDDFAFAVFDGLPICTEVEKRTPKKERLEQLMNEVMPLLPGVISYTVLAEKIMESENVKIAYAKRQISDAVNLGIIEKNEVKMYHRIFKPAQNEQSNLPF